MADGNLGSLWMSLGLKETVTKDLNKLQKEFSGTDEEAKKVQETIKEINAVLKKPTDTGAISEAFSKLTTLLEKSKTDAKDLAVVLKSINAKDVLSIFDGKITATNAKSYYELINKISIAIDSLGGTSNKGVNNLLFNLNNAAQYLETVLKVKDEVERLNDFPTKGNFLATPRELSSMADYIKSIRKDMLDLMNNGRWDNGLKDLQKDLGNFFDHISKLYAEANKISSSNNKVTEDSQKATSSLKKEEEQAKKTAEAVASIGEKKKYVAPSVQIQDKPITTDVEKTVSNTATKKLEEVKEKSDKAKSSVATLRTELNEILNAFRGKASKKLGVDDAGEKGRQLVDILNQINKKREEISRGKGGKASSKEMEVMVNNAMNYLRLLQRIDIAERTLQDKKSANPNVDASKFKEASDVISHFRDQLVKLESSEFLTGVDRAKVLKDYASAWQMALGDIDKIVGKFQKKNPLSDLDNNFAKLDSKIDSFREKLTRLRTLMSEGTSKGYNTSMLTDRITGMSGIVAQMEKAMDNDGKMLSNAERMKQLFSDMQVEMSKTNTAFQTYNREKEKVIAQEREWQSVTRSGFGGQRFAIPGREEAAQGYLDIANTYKKAADALQTKQGEAKTNLTKLLDEYNKEVKELESKIKAISPKMDGLNWKGKKLTPKYLANYEELTKQLEHLKNTKGSDITLAQTNFDSDERKLQRLIELAKEYEQLSERVAKGTYKSYNANTYEQNRISKTADLKNSAVERHKAEEQAKRDAAKATREANAAEKQRQNELENSKRRIQSMEAALAKLQEKRFTSKMLGLDTSEADAKIEHLKNQLIELRNIQLGLSMGDKSFLGRLGNIGNGREVQAANDLARSYDKANKEAQRGVDIERKRQQEIAKSAAKVQADLVRGFEKANSSAGKLNSTIQDLKSLFLQGGLVFGAQQFAMSIITTGGEMEKQHVALQSILGDMQNANTLFGQIKELALNSPFTFSELNRDVKHLAAYGVEYEDLYNTTKRLADMSSGLGVSFDRIALAFGQVQARGWLDGKELRQIAYAGIPLLSKLSALYSKREGQKVSTSEIKTRISKREVSFDDVKSVFWEMTDAGGQFYNMQQTLSETLLGRYNKLKDAWEIMLAEFASGESIVGSFFKTALDGATTLVQALHTLAMPITTIFAGYALKKALGANEGSSFLANKGKIASDIQMRVLKGEQISQIERQILVTKNRITSADLEQLANAKALTATELNRLRITGRITAEQYKSARALLLQQGAIHSNKMSLLRQLATIRTSFRNLKNGLNFSSIWSGFATSGMAAIRLVGTGIKGLATTMWSAIGGLPGLVLSGITFGITYAISSYQELSNKIKQTQDELADKNKQIYEFLRDNNISITIAKGDDKEIDNMIDAYKEKIKELAPYDYRNIYMTAEEKESHKERLKYLDEEIKRLKEANDIAASKMSNRSYYSTMTDDISDALKKLTQRQELALRASKIGASQGDKDLYRDEKAYGNYIDKLKADIEKKFGDISKDATLRKAAMQAMSALFSELKVPQDKADILRASVLQAFGIGEESDWLKEEVGTEMRNLINEVSPLIANKIKSGQKLNDAEKAKVIELMDSAKTHLKAKYPEVEDTLQKMLAASKFEAVIRLVVDDGSTYTDVQNELSRRIPSVISDKKLQEKYVKRAEEYGKDNNWYNARNAAKDRIDTALNNYQSALKSGASNTAQLKEELRQEKEIARILLHYDYDGEGKKSNKPGKTGSQKDKALENLKDRIDLYKKLYDQIKKTEDLYGKGALMQLKQDEQFKAIFNDKAKYPISDYTDYKKSIEEMLHGFNANTEDRQTFVNNEHAGIQEKHRQDVVDKRQDNLKALEDQLQIIESQYEVYKKIYKLTGNKTGSQNIAFSGTVASDSFKKYLEKELDVAVAGDNVNSGLKYTGSDVAAMSLKDVKDNYGEKTRTYTIRKRLEDENNKVKSETIDLLADIVEKNATIAQQIEDENRNYEYQKSLIENQKDLDPEMKKRALEGVEKTHNENSAKLQFEQFKQETDWVTIFDDLDRVSTNTINTMADKIDDFSKKTGHSVEVVKQLREALSKLKDEQIERNPIPGIFGGVRQGNAIGDFIKDNFSKGDVPNKKVTVSDEQAQKMGIGKKGGEYTKADLENKQKSSYNTASKAISAFANKVNAVTNVLQPVVDLFAALGNEDSILGTVTGAASNAMGAASQTSQGLEALGLKKAGPYGAAVSAALSVATTIAGLHDKALQKEIEASQQREKEMKNLSENLSSSLESTLGGVYNYERDKATNEKFSDYEKWYAKFKKMSESNDEIIAWQGKNGLKRYTEDGHDAIIDANSKNNYYTDQLTLLKMQRIEKENQLNAESDKKKKDTGVIEDLKQDMAELDQQIKDYAQDFLKNIYNVDFKSWASELTDAVVEAWEKGGDAIDAYKKKAKDVVRDLTKTIVSQKIMEMTLQKPLDFLTEELEKKGKLDETSLPKLFDLLDEAGDTAVPMITQLYEWLKSNGLDLRDNGDTSSTNTIKGITEDQADILISYVNAIRLDVSVDRENVKLIADSVSGIPELSIIAQSQLNSLNQLVMLAEYRNGKLDDMYSWMRSVTSGSGTKNIRIN